MRKHTGSSHHHDDAGPRPGSILAAELAPSTRRRFLGLGVGLGVTALSTGGCALFVTKREPDLVLVPVAGTLTLPVARFDELSGPHNAILVQNESTGEKVLLVREASGYSALSSRCTHRGCDVDYVAAAHHIVCPCHGSEYDLEGRNLKGPAKRPLTQYRVRLEAGTIRVEV